MAQRVIFSKLANSVFYPLIPYNVQEYVADEAIASLTSYSMLAAAFFFLPVVKLIIEFVTYFSFSKSTNKFWFKIIFHLYYSIIREFASK